MTISSEIIPWKCHICKNEFALQSGGICIKCKQPACLKHLSKITRTLEKESKWVCRNCLISEAKAVADK